MTVPSSLTRRQFLARTAAIGAASLTGPQLLANAARSESAQPENRGFRVGIYTRPWDKCEYRAALDAIAEAGFKHAGLMTTSTEGRRLVIDAGVSLEEAEKVGQEVKSRGLSIPSVYGGGIPVAKSLEDGIEGLKRLIDNCAAAEGRSLLMGGIGNPKLVDVYYKAIAECCDYAAERNLPITVKPHGGTNATGQQCRKCIEMVGHQNFSLWYDPGNIFFYSNGEIDPVDDAAAVDGLVKVGICVKDFTMSTDGDGKISKDVWVTPGTGMVDFPAVMSGLKKGGFTSGDLVIECVARGEGTLPEILAEAKKARKFVEELVAG